MLKRIAVLALTLASFASADKTATTKPTLGSRGGCYVTVTSKTGKTYRKYVAKDLCKAVAK